MSSCSIRTPADTFPWKTKPSIARPCNHRRKYLNNYWIDCRERSLMHSWSQGWCMLRFWFSYTVTVYKAAKMVQTLTVWLRVTFLWYLEQTFTEETHFVSRTFPKATSSGLIYPKLYGLWTKHHQSWHSQQPQLCSEFIDNQPIAYHQRTCIIVTGTL